ncbi:MAG: inositol monophosphatase family protein [Clostridia bacterium]|nr:inositol monophosphatase family protein [Clostridia bacterium]
MKELIKFCDKLLRSAGELLLKQEIAVAGHKTANDLLTENDLLIEQYLMEEIKATFPEVNIVSEETTADKPLGGVSVVIDPIDGTCNYAAGMDSFGIQIAIFEEVECVAAYMYFPRTGEMISAEKGRGAFANGKKLTVNKDMLPSDGFLLISDYYGNIAVPMDRQFELIKRLQPVFLKTRHLGAACVDFTALAKGQAAAYISYYHYIWDIAPGLLIANESGCVHALIDGSAYTYGTPGIVVANSEANLQRILSEYRALC